jgi:hypothetical protein
MNARMLFDMSNSFNHGSLYKVTGKRFVGREVHSPSAQGAHPARARRLADAQCAKNGYAPWREASSDAMLRNSLSG